MPRNSDDNEKDKEKDKDKDKDNKKRGKKKNEFQVMQDQSDAERRAVRQTLRSINSKIVHQKQDLQNSRSKAFQEIRGENNAAWSNVKYTREAVLDSANVQALATHAARQVDTMVEVPRYDATRLTLKLRQKLRSSSSSSSSFSWTTLGAQVGACFNAIPSNVVFFAGPLDADYTPKERKKTQRRKQTSDDEEQDDEQQEKPEMMKNTQKQNQMSAVEENIKIVNHTLKRKYKAAVAAAATTTSSDKDSSSKRPRGICAMQLLMNPKSFTQTIENIFHYSFLLKHGQAQLKIDPDTNSPVVEPVLESTGEAIPRQAIVSLTMAQWRSMVAAYNVQGGTAGVPHRSTTQTSTKSAAATTGGSSQ